MDRQRQPDEGPAPNCAPGRGAHLQAQLRQGGVRGDRRGGDALPRRSDRSYPGDVARRVSGSVRTDVAEARKVQEQWGHWGDGVRLVLLDSPYRLLLEPLLSYIEEIARHRQRNEAITIVVPQLVPRRKWHNLLHAQTAAFLRLPMVFRRGVLITTVPSNPAGALHQYE